MSFTKSIKISPVNHVKIQLEKLKRKNKTIEETLDQILIETFKDKKFEW